MNRSILHVDMNCFYAAVEMQRRPELRSKPVAVCGRADERHGIILTANYIAKPLGVKTGMAIWQARQRCPELVLVQADMAEYIRISALAHEIYKDYTDEIEGFGLDEAWLDVSHSGGLFGSGAKIAQEISRRVKFELGITASIGVSFNKITAKLGSDYKKPDAVTSIMPDNYEEIVYPLPVEDLLYVGAATKAKLNSRGIYTIGALAQAQPQVLVNRLGKMGEVLSRFARGEDDTPVTKCGFERAVKSVGNSCTAPRDLKTDADVWLLLLILSESVAARMRELCVKAEVIEVYTRDNELQSFLRQRKTQSPTCSSLEIAREAFGLFCRSYSWQRPVRSVGVRAAGLMAADVPIQLSLTSNEDKRVEMEKIDEAVDGLRKRYGYMSVQRGVVHTDKQLGKINPKDDHTVHPTGFFY